MRNCFIPPPHNPVNVNALNQTRPPYAGAASTIYLMSWCRCDDGRRRDKQRGRVLRGERHPVHDPADEHVNDVGFNERFGGMVLIMVSFGSFGSGMA